MHRNQGKHGMINISQSHLHLHFSRMKLAFSNCSPPPTHRARDFTKLRNYAESYRAITRGIAVTTIPSLPFLFSRILSYLPEQPKLQEITTGFGEILVALAALLSPYPSARASKWTVQYFTELEYCSGLWARNLRKLMNCAICCREITRTIAFNIPVNLSKLMRVDWSSTAVLYHVHRPRRLWCYPNYVTHSIQIPPGPSRTGLTGIKEQLKTKWDQFTEKQIKDYSLWKS